MMGYFSRKVGFEFKPYFIFLSQRLCVSYIEALMVPSPDERLRHRDRWWRCVSYWLNQTLEGPHRQIRSQFLQGVIQRIFPQSMRWNIE